MDLETALRALELANSLNYEEVVVMLFGGEPLLEWELVEKLCSEFRKNPRIIRTVIITNGLLLNKRKMDFIRDNNIFVQVSFDGIGPANKERLAGSGFLPGIIKTRLQLMKGYIGQAKMMVRMVVTPQNIAYLQKSVNYLLRLGFRDEFVFLPLMPFTRWTRKNQEEFRERCAQVLRDLPEPEMTLKINSTPAFFFNIEKGANCCCAGRDRFAVSPGGEIYSCFQGLLSRRKEKYYLGDVRDGTPAYRQRLARYLARRETQVAECPGLNAKNIIGRRELRDGELTLTWATAQCEM